MKVSTILCTAACIAILLAAGCTGSRSGTETPATTPAPALSQAAPAPAATATSGNACGTQCSDPDRLCGLWDAVWHHKNWGDNLEGTMTLCQNGSMVTGTYTLGQTQGSISATTSGVTGTELGGTWREFDPDGTVNGEGAFIFRMKSGTDTWDGWFNYYPGTAVDTSDAPAWTGTKL